MRWSEANQSAGVDRTSNAAADKIYWKSQQQSIGSDPTDVLRITEFKGLGLHIKCMLPAVHVMNRMTVFPVALNPQHGFSSFASQRHRQDVRNLFSSSSLVQISRFPPRGCSVVLLFRLLDYPVGLFSTLT